MTDNQQLNAHWKDRAACKGLGDLFFAPKGDWVASKKARAICADCPVSEECLQSALTNDERYGVWSGMGYTERQTFKMNRRSRNPVVCGTRSSYIGGCRCPECRSAQNVYMNEYKQRRRDGGLHR